MPPPPWFHHVSLTVTDLDRSVAWYRRVLALAEVARRDGPTWRRVLLGTEGFLLSVSTHDGTDGTDRFDATRVGLDHVGIGCRTRAELDAWAEHVDALGVPRSPVTEAPHAHLFTCADPDGMPVELYWLVT